MTVISDIRFNCPHCKGKLVVAGAAAGHHANCPHCSRRIQIPDQSGPVLQTVPSLPPALQTSSGIVPIESGGPILTTTQKIDDNRPQASRPVVRAPATPVVATGAAALPATVQQKPVVAPASPSDSAVQAGKFGSVSGAQKIASTSGQSDAQARQLLTNLIDGLKRENADLKKKLAAVPVSPIAPAVAARPAAATSTAELEQLRKSSQESTARLAERETKISELESACSKLREELDAATKKLAAAGAEAASARAELESSQKAATERQQQVATNAECIKELEAKVAAFAEDATKAAGRITDLEARLAVAASDASKARDEARMASEASVQLREQIASQDGEAAGAKLEIEKLHHEIEKLSANLNTAREDRDHMASDAALARQSVRDLAAREARLKSELDSAVRSAADSGRREKELSQRIETLERDGAGMAGQLAESRTRVSELETKLSSTGNADELRQEIGKLRGELAEAQTRLTSACNETARLASGHVEAEKTATELRERITKLVLEIEAEKSYAAQAASTMEKLRNDWTQQLETQKQLEAKVARATEDAERLTSEKAALLVSTQEADDRAKAACIMCDEVQSLRDNLTESRSRVHELEGELDIATKASAAADLSRKHVEDLEAENRKLRDDARRMQHELFAAGNAESGKIMESRLRRRIEELEESLRTNETIVRQLRDRLTAIEGGKPRA